MERGGKEIMHKTFRDVNYLGVEGNFLPGKIDPQLKVS